MYMSSFLFTSESVTEGHPDKICDQISDAILDACLQQDPFSRVAVETAVKDKSVFLLGEVTSKATIDPDAIARGVIRGIGYTDEALGFSAESAAVHVHLSQQSPDIAQGVSLGTHELGAGDQGMMFGYADTQTEEFLPLPISLAHRLARRLAQVRKDGTLPWLGPDGKTQVTVQYKDGAPKGVAGVVVSTQHSDSVSLEELRAAVRMHVVDAVIPASLQRADMNVFINPTGRFVVGGPVGDSGVTGRKIIVDTYGGWARHGGGAFSGKDATKVDRSAAYAARQAARSVVAAGLAERCEIQLAYAIGVPHPVSIFIETFGTERVAKTDIAERLASLDFSPAGIIERLGLRQPGFQATAAYGHFGRPEFSWEHAVPLGRSAQTQVVSVGYQPKTSIVT